jgi:phosphoserine phosphatase RsbU/P
VKSLAIGAEVPTKPVRTYAPATPSGYATGVDDTAPDSAESRLRRIESVTDAALSELDTDSFFNEMLDRVRQVLDVDAATILLLDEDSERLIATASRGFEEEVRQGFRIDIGEGFAGQVAKERQPVVLAEVTRENVRNPVLHEKGVRSLLGVPMIVGGEFVGVLHVGTMTPREFTPEDIALLQMVADRTALASQARANRLDRDAALALQRSLLPTRLPSAPGVDMAARYVPGHHTGVGGDWYDVFTLPSGWLGVVIGDVSGHGLRSAVVMGRLRSALRAYALECDDPADALTRLDAKVRHFETGSLATVLYSMISPDRDTLLVSMAGHLPPLLATPGQPAVRLSIPVELPVGTGIDAKRGTTSVPLPKQASLVLYTDGLIERREEPITVGLERLRKATHHSSAEAMCYELMAHVAPSHPTDDIALLAVRRLN